MSGIQRWGLDARVWGLQGLRAMGCAGGAFIPIVGVDGVSRNETKKRR